MWTRWLLISCWFSLSPAALADEGLKCDAHQHMVAETDEEQGAKVKRCVCDAGWDADGPGKPCRQAKAEPAKKAREKASTRRPA